MFFFFLYYFLSALLCPRSLDVFVERCTCCTIKSTSMYKHVQNLSQAKECYMNSCFKNDKNKSRSGIFNTVKTMTKSQRKSRLKRNKNKLMSLPTVITLFALTFPLWFRHLGQLGLTFVFKVMVSAQKKRAIRTAVVAAASNHLLTRQRSTHFQLQVYLIQVYLLWILTGVFLWVLTCVFPMEPLPPTPTPPPSPLATP
jgi:hypothetical protein